MNNTSFYPFDDNIPQSENCLEFQFVTTDHLTDRIWFKDDLDFKTGMNYVAIISLALGINVIAFILMSNHVHFVLQCSYEEAERFINEYKRRYSQYLQRRYGKTEFLRRNDHTIESVSIEDESFERSIAYTLMNSVAANICLNVTDYPWGSAGAYFRVTKRKGKSLNEYSSYSLRKMLHSKAELPDHLIIGEDGYILPESFIPVRFVESVFRSPGRLNYFMSNSSKAKKRLASAEKGLPTFTDQVMHSAIHDMCRTIFRKNSIDELNREQKTTLISEVRRRFSADANQIGRVVGIPYSEVIKMLEDF